MAGPIFSVGHGDRSLADLIAILVDVKVRSLVDVRAFPASRRHPHFSREPLAAALRERNIAYRWMGRELGGFRKPHSESRHRALRSDAFRGFADHMETSLFAEALTEMAALAEREGPLALMCAERHPLSCHRRLIADALLAQNLPVVHLIEYGRSESHVLSHELRLDGMRLIYDIDTRRFSGQRKLDL